MTFPSPPPLKPKPSFPAPTAALKIKHPSYASLIVGISIVFWVIVLLIPVSVVLYFISPWLSSLPGAWLIKVVVLGIASWIGFSIGWRVGNAIIIVAFRRN